MLKQLFEDDGLRSVQLAAAYVLALHMTRLRSEGFGDAKLHLFHPGSPNDTRFVQQRHRVGHILAAIDVEEAFAGFWTRQNRVLGHLVKPTMTRVSSNQDTWRMPGRGSGLDEL